MGGAVIAIAAVVAVMVAAAAQEMPLINVDGVSPNQPGSPRPLTPGIEVSLYGQHLGPKTGCTAGAGAWSVAKPLCETAVTVGGVPAALLYVQDNQINLRVPFNVPTEGMVPFVVTRGAAPVPPSL